MNINKLFLISIFAIWPFGLLLNLGSLGKPIYLLDLFVALFSIYAFISRYREIVKNRLFQSLLQLCLVVSIGLLINWRSFLVVEPILSLGYFLRFFLYPSVFFLVQDYKSESKMYLNFSLVLFLVLGVTQYIFFPDMRYLKFLGFDDHYYRLIGTFYDPNFAGAVLAGSSMYFLVKKKYFMSTIMLIGLALTFSRASYLSFVISLVFYIFYTKQYKLFFSLLFLSSLIFLAPKPFGEGVNLMRTYSISSRIHSWESGVELFKQKPLFGWGYNLLRSENGGRFSTDNSFILLLATTGIVGFFAFVNLLVQIWKNISIAGKTFLLSILVHSIFNNTLLFAWIYLLYWIIAGIETKEYR